MILRTTVELAKMPPEVVMAPTGAVPTFITSAEVGSVVANAETAPSRALPAVTRRSPAVTVMLSVVPVIPPDADAGAWTALLRLRRLHSFVDFRAANVERLGAG